MKTAAPEKKSAKTLKGQLFGAVSMMLVAAIALGTSTYAWFINNRTVEVQNMQLTVSTSTSLLVAVGKKAAVTAAAPMAPANVATNWTGYKSLVANQDITGLADNGDVLASTADAADWYLGDNTADRLKQNLLSLEMTPASISSRGLMSTATGSTPALTFFATDNHVANGLLDQFTPISVGTGMANVGMGSVKRIPFKFNASVDTNVYFGSDLIPDGIADMVSPTIVAGGKKPGGGTYDATTDKSLIDASLAEATAIKAALRVAIVPQNTTLFAGPVKPMIFQFNNGTLNSNSNKNNTDYSHLPANGLYPNVDNDTASSDAVTTIQLPKLGKYAAIKTVDWNGSTGTKNINAAAIQQTIVPGAEAADQATLTADYVAENYWASVDKSSGTAVVTPPASGKPIFQLNANEERMVDVYIWLEGTDEDCLNDLSGYSFNLSLPFCGVDTTT